MFGKKIWSNKNSTLIEYRIGVSLVLSKVCTTVPNIFYLFTYLHSSRFPTDLYYHTSKYWAKSALLNLIFCCNIFLFFFIHIILIFFIYIALIFFFSSPIVFFMIFHWFVFGHHSTLTLHQFILLGFSMSCHCVKQYILKSNILMMYTLHKKYILFLLMASTYRLLRLYNGKSD